MAGWKRVKSDTWTRISFAELKKKIRFHKKRDGASGGLGLSHGLQAETMICTLSFCFNQQFLIPWHLPHAFFSIVTFMNCKVNIIIHN